MHFETKPISREEAREYIDRIHRHHDGATIDKYRFAIIYDGKMCGVVQVGRPKARMLDDGESLEVVRLCTDGTRNACTYGYSMAAKIAKLLGYKRIYTYILDTENGASLKASGYVMQDTIRGHSWDTPGRKRNTTAPTCNKSRWVKEV